jgi:hypothetical protein
MADKTNLDGHKFKPPLDKLADIGFHRKKNMPNDTSNRKRSLVHIGMYFIAPILILFFLMMCRYR